MVILPAPEIILASQLEKTSVFGGFQHVDIQCDTEKDSLACIFNKGHFFQILAERTQSWSNRSFCRQVARHAR